MMFWQRKEVYLTDSTHKFDEICSILSKKGIKYDFKVKNREQFFRGTSPFLGHYGTDPLKGNMYYIYVNKNDYDYAKELCKVRADK